MSSGGVRVITVALLPDADEAVEFLREGGVVARGGHTGTTYEETLRALDASFSKATHIYNAMSPFEHRDPDTVGALLADNRVRTDIIADGMHVHEGALFLAYREKGLVVSYSLPTLWRRPGWLKASTSSADAGSVWRTARPLVRRHTGW